MAGEPVAMRDILDAHAAGDPEGATATAQAFAAIIDAERGLFEATRAVAASHGYTIEASTERQWISGNPTTRRAR